MKPGKAARAMEYLDEDLLASAMEDPAPRTQNTGKQLPERRHLMKNMKTWQKWVAAAAMFAIVLSGGLLLGHFLGVANAPTVVALDVNPSIELEINKEERVVAVRPLNKEAETVIGIRKLEGKTLEEAVDEIVSVMADKGFLATDRNSILISVDARNEETAKALRDKMADKVTLTLEGKSITVAIITQDFDKRTAAGEGVSAAKASLVKKIVARGLQNANGVPYTEETLASLSIHELKLILDSKGFAVDGTESTGTAAAKFVPLAAVRTAVLANAGCSYDEAKYYTVELDYDSDRRILVYEIEFVYDGNEYEYEIDAKTGAILEKDVEPQDDREIPNTPSDACMTREEALAIAYKNAGVDPAAVIRPKIELERENGIYVYDIEFKTADREYEYEINAETGAVIKADNEPRD